MYKNVIILHFCHCLFPQSPRKALATANANETDVSAPKQPKFKMDKPETSNKFDAIKSEVTMEFNPELEPLLRENPRRFVIFPIQYKDIWAMYKQVKFYLNILSFPSENTILPPSGT